MTKLAESPSRGCEGVGAELPRIFFALTSAGLLAACATTPLVIDASHPASVDAPEGAVRTARPMLRLDASTRRTRELLAERQQQAAAAESEKPGDLTTIKPAAPSGKEERERR